MSECSKRTTILETLAPQPTMELFEVIGNEVDVDAVDGGCQRSG
jgi:hypothetical protein